MWVRRGAADGSTFELRGSSSTASGEGGWAKRESRCGRVVGAAGGRRSVRPYAQTSARRAGRARCAIRSRSARCSCTKALCELVSPHAAGQRAAGPRGKWLVASGGLVAELEAVLLQVDVSPSTPAGGRQMPRNASQWSSQRRCHRLGRSTIAARAPGWGCWQRFGACRRVGESYSAGGSLPIKPRRRCGFFS